MQNLSLLATDNHELANYIKDCNFAELFFFLCFMELAQLRTIGVISLLFH